MELCNPMAIKPVLNLQKTEAHPEAQPEPKHFIEAIYLAQAVQYAGTMRTFFRFDDGFELDKREGNIIVTSKDKGYGRYLEIGFSNISAVLWNCGSR